MNRIQPGSTTSLVVAQEQQRFPQPAWSGHTDTASGMAKPAHSQDITALLAQWRDGPAAVLEHLIPMVYTDLRKVARAYLRREPAGQSLQATALVHEVYMRLLGMDRLRAENRAHFIAVAARLMRQILVDHARRKRAGKRGGAVSMISLEGVNGQEEPQRGGTKVDLLELDRALDELASFDPQQSQIVEMKFFGGLTIDETAKALNISSATVEREWVIARAWLYDHLQ
jgi:RNA polymerase sigma factor (TIGR02999 family)